MITVNSALDIAAQLASSGALSLRLIRARLGELEPVNQP